MTEKIKITVCYSVEKHIDRDLDARIKKLFDLGGFEYLSQGVDIKSGVRDINFEWEREQKR